jgi:flagellar basal body P-ring protein FlgI
MIACIGTGNATQSNAISGVVNATLQIPTWITGLVVTLLVALVILGGVKRIASVNEKIVPAMAILCCPDDADTLDNIVDLMTKVEQLQIQPDSIAKVVIDESTGIVVIGKDVKINRLAIAQGNLTIKITDVPFVSQPEPFTLGEQVVFNTTLVDVEEQTDAKMKVLDTGINLQELVDGLNALGVTPRDLISILQAIKASGALQAEIEVI